MTKIAGARVIDIAHEAGVSIATVDRVLNKRKGVRTMTAERVWEAVERLGTERPFPVPGRDVRRGATLDFILPTGAGPNIENLQAALLRAGEAQGAEVRCHPVERLNPALLAESIEAVANGSNGIGLVALEHPLVRTALETVQARGLPIVTLMSDLSSSARLAYIGINNRAAGRTAGYLMGRFLRGTPGKVAILAGSSLYRNHEEREMGFRSVLREQFPDLQMLDLVVGQDHPEANYEQINSLLKKHRDLAGIYSIGSGNRGVVQAMKEQNKTANINLIAHNLTTTSRDFLLDGSMDAVIHQDVEREAELALRVLLSWSPNGHVETKTLPVQIFVRENIVA